MTTAIAPPPEYRTPTASAASVVKAPPYAPANGNALSGSYFPDGIEYDRWSRAVQPAPRALFADRLDLLDILEDD